MALGESENNTSLSTTLHNLLSETPPKPPLLPNPWTSPGPESTEQPQLVVKLSHFTNRALKCHNGDYPYELPINQPHQIPFYEILGHGPPPSDVAGNPGDVYLDLTPPCSVYVREMKGWDRWDWSSASRFQFVTPTEHPILSNRYLWAVKRASSFRLSWLTRQSLKNHRHINIAEIIPGVYQELFAPSNEEGKLQIETSRSQLEDHKTLTSLGAKRGRSPSPMGGHRKQLISSNDTPASDIRPKKKKANFTLDEARDKEVAEERMSPDKQIDDTKGPARRGGEDAENGVDVAVCVSEPSSASGVIRTAAGLAGDGNALHMRSDVGAGLDSLHTNDKTSGNVNDDKSRGVKESAGPADVHTKDGNPTIPSDTPDVLTTRALALFTSVRDLDDARLEAERRAKAMKLQMDNLKENAQTYEAKVLALENEVKNLTTANRKAETERKALGEAEEKIRSLSAELKLEKSNCAFAEDLNATYRQQCRELVAKEKENEKKILELSTQCAEANTARLASETALAEVKKMLRKIAV